MAVIFCFALLLVLWILREPQVVPGWGEMFKDELVFKSLTEKKNTHLTFRFVSDATSAMFIVILLFTLPEKLPSSRGNKLMKF